MKRLLATAVLVLSPLLAQAAQGCTNQASPETIPDGVTNISKAMRGYWGAPGGRQCRWWISTKSRGGTVTHNGNTTGPATRRVQKPGTAADRSQGVIIGTGNVGQFLHSDRCKGWSRR